MVVVFGIIGMHIIGFVVFLTICCKNGTMEHAAKYGDGIHEERPSGIVLWVFLWEIFLLVSIFDFVPNVINKHFRKKYDSKSDSN